jgi:hypothetical protein
VGHARPTAAGMGGVAGWASPAMGAAKPDQPSSFSSFSSFSVGHNRIQCIFTTQVFCNFFILNEVSYYYWWA